MPNPHFSHGLHLVALVTPPDPFITLAEAKEWARIDTTDHDTLVTSLLQTACKMLEGQDGLIGKAISEQTWSVSFRKLTPQERAYLPVTPALSITSITYYLDGVETTLDVNDYTLYENEDWAYVVPKDGQAWPSAFDDREDAITITYRAGFGDIDAVPVDLKTAAKILTRNLYDYPDAAVDGRLSSVPFSVETIIGKYRKGWVA